MEKGILLEQTEKILFKDEDYAEQYIETQKNQDFDLIDYKVSKKENKTNGEYFIVTLKKRFKTLAEGQESL